MSYWPLTWTEIEILVPLEVISDVKSAIYMYMSNTYTCLCYSDVEDAGGETLKDGDNGECTFGGSCKPPTSWLDRGFVECFFSFS